MRVLCCLDGTNIEVLQKTSSTILNSAELTIGLLYVIDSGPRGDMERTREVFEASTDFTLAIEEEFQILDPATRGLAQRFTAYRARRQQPARAELAADVLRDRSSRSGRDRTTRARYRSR